MKTVIARLEKGEKLRTGYTFNLKAWFENGDLVPAKTMKRLKDAGVIEQDRDGFIRLSK